MQDFISSEWAGILASTKHLKPNQARVARLFEESREEIFRYLLSLGLDPQSAQDATQEVFLRLYNSLQSGDDIRNARAWLFRVAHNHGLRVRQQQQRMPLWEPDAARLLADPQADPEQALLDRERLERVRQAFNGLSEQQQRCLHLRLEGLRYQEIADVLGIASSSVSEFLRRAIERLRGVRHG